MQRFLLIGTLALAFSGSGLAAAGAAEPATTIATAAVATAPEGGAVSPAALAAARRRLAALEAVAPTDGADVAMWGASNDVETRGADEPQPAAKGLKHGFVRRFAGGIASRTAGLAASLTRNALRFLGVPYVFGGTSTLGFDCSGYVQHVFAMLGRHLPRTADAQYVAGHRIRGAMEVGDLVFFQTYEAGPSHVGIYMGNDRFVHASSSHGVTVSSLHDRYWSARYLGAKRVLGG